MEYDSFHPEHVKNNIPYNFFKKIIIFTSNCDKEKRELERMRNWLYSSKYPKAVVDRALHNARLQGPAPDPKTKKNVIPFVTLNCDNYTNKSVVKKASLLLEKCPDLHTKNVFQQRKIVQALRQPPSIHRQLTSAKFDSTEIERNSNGIFNCGDKRCKICKLYLMQCDKFKVANGQIWNVQSHITCQSKLVVYYQICTGCNEFSNVGKTNDLRKRTNVHISSCRLGGSTDRFDNHVFTCKIDDTEPFFKLYVLIKVNDIDKLLIYENYFQKQGFDTLNRDKARV